MPTVTTHGAEGTRALAARIAGRLQGGDVLLLRGDLGAGKTTFVQGLARGLGYDGPVTSPTFTLIHEYRGGRLTLYHVDPYRLAGAEDIADLGFDELLEQGGVVAVEWAERLGVLTPPTHLDVRLSAAGDDGEAREVTVAGEGAGPAAIAAALEAERC